MKKMKRNNRQRVLALLLAVILVLSCCTVAFAADDEETGTAAEAGEEREEAEEIRWETIRIASPEDLESLSDQCTLDTWSRNKIVELDADLSLDGVDFTPIASFGGTFRGNGHTISGLKLTGKLSTAGLFRTLQKSGKIESLHVIGTLELSGSCEAAGGIVGENYGKISGCSFSGTVSGSLNTGGIAGFNGDTGTIQNCEVSGAVYGSKMTGGIVGCSKGTVSECTNLSYVNTASSDETFSADDLSMDFSFDLSGISKTEAPNTTTDTGGIAGYSSGILHGCTNSAVIGYPHVGYNVGGIAGRSCGYLYSCENTGSIHGRKDVGGIVGQMEPYIELDLSEGYLAKMQRQLDELNELVDKAADDAQGGAGGISSRLSSMSGSVQNAAAEASSISVVIDSNGSVTASGGGENGGSVTVTPPNISIGDSGVEVTPGGVDVSGSVSGSGEASGAAQIIATPDLGGLTSAINSIGGQISALNSAISGTAGVLAEDVRAINEKYNELTNTMFDAIFSVGTAEGDIIRDISDVDIDFVTLGKMRKAINRGAVNGDLNVGGIAGTMAIEYELDPEDDVTSNLSAEYKQEYTVKAVIQRCKNYGLVTAKRSYVGGITGKMDLGLILRSYDFGDVTSESGSYVGGIVGLTGATVRNSFAKCTLSGEKYIGGIAGSGITETITGVVSSGSEGTDSGSSVSGCYSMVDISSAQQYYGAISGTMAGDYSENYFVSDTLAGIDGQSYGGQAEPISYTALLSVAGLPAEMKKLTLRFTDGDTILKECSFDYDDSFDETDYPEIPEKEACYAYWDRTDLRSLHFDTVVTAVYEPYITTLSVDTQRENGKSIFYVEGEFDDSAVLTASKRPEDTSAFTPVSEGLGAAVRHYLTENTWYSWPITPLNRALVEQWSITVPDDGHSEQHKVHYLSPDEDANCLRVFVLQNGTWEKLDTETFGSYLVFALPEGESEIAFVSVLYVWWIWAILLVLAAALAVGLVLLCRKCAKKRKNRKLLAENADEDAPSARIPKKKKRWVLLLVVGLLVLMIAVAAVWYFLIGFDSEITVFRALTSLEEQKSLSACLTVDTEIDGESLHTQTALERRTFDGIRITRVELEEVTLYYAREQVILENGRAYRLGALFPDYSDLLKRIVPMYQNMEFEENADICQVSVEGETAQKLLQAIVPDIAEQLSETQSLTVQVQRKDDSVQKIEISASGVLQDDTQSTFSVSVSIDSIDTASDMEVPQAVIDKSKEDPNDDAPVITEDLLRLLSVWIRENRKDSISADVTLLADCGPVVLRDSLKLYRQAADDRNIYCISKGGVNLYWRDGTIVDENGQAVSGERTKSAKTGKLLNIAYLACLEGDFTKSEQDDTCVYSVRLDADAMAEIGSIIAPDADKLNPLFQNGTLTLSIRSGEITGFTISCTGTVTVAAAKVSASVAAEFRMTEETVTIPKRAADAV